MALKTHLVGVLDKVIGAICLLFYVLIHSSEAQVTTTLPPTTPADDGGFFDDDNNKAMYLVLPAMVLIYGGCAAIYCVHRCRRSCLRSRKAKLKEEKKRLKEKERLAFSNPAASDGQPRHRPDDLDHSPSGAVFIPPRPATSAATLELENLDDGEEGSGLIFTEGRSKSAGNRRSKTAETDVDAIEDTLQSDDCRQMGAVAPGYTDTDLSKEMMHLDNQLKAAFRLTQDTSKTVAPEITDEPTTGNFKTPMDYKNLETPPSGGAEAAPIPVVAGDPATDYESMLKIRRKLNKSRKQNTDKPAGANAKSKPDIRPMPEENAMAIKRVHIKAFGDKKKIFHSSQ